MPTATSKPATSSGNEKPKKGKWFIDELRKEILEGLPVRFTWRCVGTEDWEARTPEEKIETRLSALACYREAQRCKDTSSHIPFYAQRAAKTGDDWNWLLLAASYGGDWDGREKDLLKLIPSFPEFSTLTTDRQKAMLRLANS